MKSVSKAAIEVSFIVFLFYSNLLMGEFERSGAGREKGLIWAIGEICTRDNFLIAALCGLTGYGLVEFLRKRSM